MHFLQLKFVSSALTSENLSEVESIALCEPDVTVGVTQDGICLKRADEEHIYSVAMEMSRTRPSC